jgi:hypothetical protein
MAYTKRFCPTCGVEQPSVDRRCTLCGSPVRLVSRPPVRLQRSAGLGEWRNRIDSSEGRAPAA